MKTHKLGYETLYELTAHADAETLFNLQSIAADCSGGQQYWPIIERSAGRHFIVRQAYIRRCAPQVNQTLSVILDTPTVLLCIHGYALCWRPYHSLPIYAGCRQFENIADAINYWGRAESNPYWMAGDTGFHRESRKARAAMFAANLYELLRKLAAPGATVESVLEQCNVKV